MTVAYFFVEVPGIVFSLQQIWFVEVLEKFPHSPAVLRTCFVTAVLF